MVSVLLRLILLLMLIGILIHGVDGRRTHRLSHNKLRAKDIKKKNEINAIERKIKSIMDRLNYAELEVDDRYEDNYWEINNVYEHWDPMGDPSKPVTGKNDANAHQQKTKKLTKTQIAKKEQDQTRHIHALVAQEKMKKAVKAKGIDLTAYYKYYWVNIHGVQVAELYHATNAKKGIEESMKLVGPQAAMKLSASENNKILGKGIYFCDNPAAAAVKSQGGNNYIVKAKVLLGKPWDMPSLYDLMAENLNDDDAADLTWPEVVERRKCDSIIVRTVRDTYPEEKQIMKNYNDVKEIKDANTKKKIQLYQAAEYVVYNPLFVKIVSIDPKSKYNL